MNSCLDCIPCFLRQTIAACRMAGITDERTKAVIDKVSQLIPQFDLMLSPPEIVVDIHSIIRRETGDPDPYLKIKQESNRRVLAVYPQLKAVVGRAPDRLQEAVRLAIAGNILDYGALAHINLNREITAILEQDRKLQVNDRLLYFPDFRESLARAQTILYLGDNAGEIVFDRILLETIHALYPGKRLYFAVRGKPAINDVLAADAEECGIANVATVVSNGTEVPGTLLDKCAAEFLDIWKQSDLIISKGQGNFESLYRTAYRTRQAANTIYYLFVAKCAMIAGELGCAVRDSVLLKDGVLKR